ncbi:MAG TPA: FtsQ-type POTRA domain-containing protein [Kiritimatiellae bacterium]|nr:FtsQ-type POTRA domain-containing protein [Kiritimatiellia bacterium]
MRRKSRRGAGTHELFVLLRGTEVHRRRRSGRTLSKVTAAAFLAVAGLGALSYGVMLAGRMIFVESPLFRIRELDLHSDGRLRPEHIREYTGLRAGQGIFEVDFGEVAAALRSVPLVADVEIVRHLPDRLEVSVKERIPLARVRGRRRGLFYAVDAEGYVLAPTYGSSALPVIEWSKGFEPAPGEMIRDPCVRDALFTLDFVQKEMAESQLRIETIKIGDPELLDLQLSGGTRVLLAREDLPGRLKRVAAIMQACRQHGRGRPAFIDATVDGDYPARFR